MRTGLRNGFTLLELLIYLLFFAFIAMATVTWMVRLWQASTRRNAQQETAISMYMAHDMLLRDLQRAPSYRAGWKEISKTCIIWHTKGGDVGWQKDGERLVRRTGRYNADKKQWSAQTKNLIADHVSAVQFVCGGAAEITHISFAITVGTVQVHGVATPKCRRLPWK